MYSIVEKNYKLTAISHHHIICVPSVLETEAGLDQENAEWAGYNRTLC